MASSSSTGGGDPLSEAIDMLDQFNTGVDDTGLLDGIDDVDDDNMGIDDAFDDFAIDSDDEGLLMEEDLNGGESGAAGGSAGGGGKGSGGQHVAGSSANDATRSGRVNGDAERYSNGDLSTSKQDKEQQSSSHWSNEKDVKNATNADKSSFSNGSATAANEIKSKPFVHPLQDFGTPTPTAGAAGSPSNPGLSQPTNLNSSATVQQPLPSGGVVPGGTANTSWSSFSSNFASFASRAAASVQSAVESAEAAVLSGNTATAIGGQGVGGGVGPTSGTNNNYNNNNNNIASKAPSAPISYQERQKILHQQYSATNGSGMSLNTSNMVQSSPSSASSASSSPSKAASSIPQASTNASIQVAEPTPTTTPPTKSSSSSLAHSSSATFLEKLTSSLDTATKTNLISSALGQLLPGERVIMFLNSLKDVKDSRFPQLMVGSDDVLGSRLKELLSGGNTPTSGESNGNESIVTVWCCVMTFYRVAVFSYQCTGDGQVLFHEGNGNDAIGSDGVENSHNKDNNSDQEKIIQQWIQSQSVSVQFQEAHFQKHLFTPTQNPKKHRVFQMPLASIERVEKIMSSAQNSLVGTAPSSSSNSTNYPGIFPSSSTVSSASSAMSNFGSQMKPLLGGMGINPTGGSGGMNSTGGGNSNFLTNNSSNLNVGSSGSGGSVSNTMGATSSTGPLGIVLHGKDGGRWIKFSTNSYTDAMRAHEALQTYAFPGRRNLGYLFAFESRRAEVMAGGAGGEGQSNVGDGVKQPGGSATPPTRRRFVPMEEFERQGIFSPRGDENNSFMSITSPWAPILSANANYGLCSTYPSVLVGPSSVVGGVGSIESGDPFSNDGNGLPDNGIGLLRRCAAFRSENRLPTLTWGNPNHGGSIWRSSQPKVGLQGNRSIEDERYLYAIGEDAKRANLAADARAAGGVGGGSNSKDRPPVEFLRMLCGRNNESDLIVDGSNCTLKILDMRPKSAAMANRTQGYGYENTNYYRGTSINFYGIGNIHAVRDAYQKLCALCLSPNANDIQWMQLVENTNWPSMTRLILSASWQTAFHVHYNRLPILLHCSHGWDRTSQVAALSQLLLDPYYRTREGFSTLVEKDFLSFGHPFHTRCGHGEGKNEQGGDEGQLSPIFMQFLDCVFQLVNQFPDYFEFNSRYLLLLSEHIYSCRFGTLLCDSEREREVVAGIRQRTYCMWEYLDSIPELINPMFDATASAKAGVLLMPLPMLLRNVTLWVDRFCMYGAKATIPCMPHGLHYPPQYMEMNQSEQRSMIHTTRDSSEGILRRALEDAEMWRGTALTALKEVEELRKKVEDCAKESEEASSSVLVST